MTPMFSSFVHLFASRAQAGGKMRKVVHGVAKWVVNLRRARANRCAFAELTGWDDHMLADIGLNRSVIDGALEAGFATDPSLIVTKDRYPAPAVTDLPARRLPMPMPAGCWAY